MDAAACPWDRFAPATMAFCERRLCAWVVEPANTWSNVSYVLVGFWILWSQQERGRLRTPLTLVGVTAILVAIGSVAFHGTGTFLGEVLDVSAMYLISGLFITFAAKRLFLLSDKALQLLYWSVALSAIGLLVATRVSGIPLFVLHVTVAVIFEAALFRRHARGLVDYRPLWALIAFFTAAFVVWNLDVSHVLCDPDNHVFGGHAFWHLTNAFCLWFFYVFQRQFESPALDPTAARAAALDR
jgi:hypothetical protein